LHVLLASVGPDGDVNPFVALGICLRARGHTVTLLTNDHFRDTAARHGFAFHALISAAEYEEFLGHPDMWHPVKTIRRTARWAIQFLERQYELVAEQAQAADTVLVANVGMLGARLVQEKLGRPLATVILQPWMIPSSIAPPVMPGGLTLPRGAPRWAAGLYWSTFHALGELLIGRPLQRLRTALGLKRARRIFDWWLSPQLVIGMFPDCYGPAQRDWPPQIRLAGFPLYDGGSSAGLQPELEDFCRAGSPPVAITFGTGMMHATDLFRAAVDGCRRLGVRAILLTQFGKQVPAALPPSVRHVGFAPFHRLFPHCAAVIHHGGVGTKATALATGTPQLILPLAFDQLDNATRVRRLEMGDWLRPRQRSGSAIAKALARLTTSKAQTHCRAGAARFAKDDALATTARWIEELRNPPDRVRS
jgi:rhamnosyltransferase subunit B